MIILFNWAKPWGLFIEGQCQELKVKLFQWLYCFVHWKLICMILFHSQDFLYKLHLGSVAATEFRMSLGTSLLLLEWTLPLDLSHLLLYLHLDHFLTHIRLPAANPLVHFLLIANLLGYMILCLFQNIQCCCLSKY